MQLIETEIPAVKVLVPKKIGDHLTVAAGAVNEKGARERYRGISQR